MDSSIDERIIMDVGSRLKVLRTERGKSMRALARASGLSTNALSMIERGRTSPSVSTLFKLAEALDVPITAFFRVESDRNDIVFRKKTDRKRIVIPNGIWEGLGGESFTGRVEAFTITLEPDASSGPFGILHTGAEFVLCLEGEVRYQVEDRAFILEPGDSLIFTAQRRHRWENLTRSRSKLVVVISGFETDEQPSEFHLVSGTQRNPLPNDGK